jgi:histidine triad (HIT) family protein
MDCIFCRIAAGEIPAAKLFEDEQIMAFSDRNPQAPVHLLVVPRKHIPSLAELDREDEALLGRMHSIAARLAGEKGLEDGFRTVINTGDGGGQTVPHLHFHVLGGRRLGWPPG